MCDSMRLDNVSLDSAAKALKPDMVAGFNRISIRLALYPTVTPDYYLKPGRVEGQDNEGNYDSQKNRPKKGHDARLL